MTDRYDIVIVGAGIVGLATAMQLVQARPDLKLVVLEKETQIATHQTGHNSGVIHAGLYYKPGSIKAETAVEGARQMIEFCQEHGLPYELCGKVVVALNEQELPRLEELYRRGAANGVPGLERISGEQIREREPQARGIAGLWSPKTGIVDYVAVCRTYAQIVKKAGGEIRLGTEVISIEQRLGELQVYTTRGDVRGTGLVNCGGLQSDRIARMTGGSGGVRIVPFRGEYFELAPRARELVHGLLYPVPDPRFPFLGVHFTKKIDGRVEAGPNAVLGLTREGYGKADVSPGHVLRLLAFPGFWPMAARYWRMGFGEIVRSWYKPAFTRALQQLVPALTADDLSPGGAGLRAQALDSRGNLLDDFRFLESPQAIHVLNAPSPGATASISIGRSIADKALAALGLDRSRP